MVGLAVVVLSWSVHAADAPRSPIVSALERLHDRSERTDSGDDDDDPQLPTVAPRDPVLEGRVLLGELNCLACHAASDEWKSVVSPKQAPILDHLATRVKVDWLRDSLRDVHAAKAGTTMPDVLHGMSPGEREAAAEALVHFLIGKGGARDIARDLAAARRGKDIYHQVGCTACHDPQEGNGPPLATSAPLPNLSRKYSSASLAAFLKDAHATRPSGRMPIFPLTDQQLRDVAHYLVRDVSVKPNVRYAVYHGSWDEIPNFAELKAVDEGFCGGFDLGVGGRTNDFGVRFEGELHLPQGGRVTLHLGSDDGSRLLIDGRTIINNDGIHAHQERSAGTELESGWHNVVVEYIQAGGEWTLNVEIEGNGLPRQALGALLRTERHGPAPETTAPAVRPELIELGRQVFQARGCAACHALHRDGMRLSSKIAAQPLAELKPDAGCLAAEPPARVPNYRLSARQRSDLAAALQARPRETAAQSLHRLLLTFNCYACHARDGWGGPEESRGAYFNSLIQEMGDESRLPPTLTGAGDKLQENWLSYLLEHGADDRKNYMLVRMPRFGTANVAPLAELFVQVDRRSESSPRPDFPEPEYRIKAAGRHLVGGAALSCIKCHDFREYPSTGIRAISLTTMPRRLREDWFSRYLLNPQEYRPGTRMPAPWPNGRASIAEVLNGDASLQIRAVWTYLSDGDKAAVPVGLVREPIELKPTTAPIIYRNFIEGAGQRAIGVGYPEQLNLAFDANDFRLALIWHGSFLDASRHWNDRGAGTVAPLGDNVIELGPHPSFARLGSAEDSWPTTAGREAGFRFLGYSLDPRQQPTFRYRFGDVTIEDHPEPFSRDGDQYPGLRRTLVLSGNNAGDLYYRAAVATQLEQIDGGAYRIDGAWMMRVVGGETPMLRESAGHKELLVRVKWANGRARLMQEYVW
jgi:mono/diheme cytochrome c family protein